MEASTAYSIASYIYKTFTIVFLVVGTLTNILSALVYSRRKMRKTSYSVYLFSLAVVDLLVTVTGNIRILLMVFPISLDSSWSPPLLLNDGYDSQRFIFRGVDVRETSVYACRIHRFLTYSLLQFSSILLSLLSIDRFIGCVLVLKASRFCKPSIARRIVLILVVLTCLFNLHFFIWMGHDKEIYDPVLNRTVNRTVCEPINTRYAHFWSVYFYFDSMIYCVLPFIIMITCNILIITKIISSRIRSKQVTINRMRKHHGQNYSFQKSASTQNQSQCSSYKSRPSTTSSNMNYTRSSPRHAQSGGRTNYLLASERRISIILVGISISFFVFTLPVFIMENLSDSYFSNPLMEIGLAISYMLMYFNHVSNFFFYCFLGPNFRKEVRKLVPSYLYRSNRVWPYQQPSHHHQQLSSKCHTTINHKNHHHVQVSNSAVIKYKQRELVSNLNLTTSHMSGAGKRALNSQHHKPSSLMRNKLERIRKNSIKYHVFFANNHNTLIPGQLLQPIPSTSNSVTLTNTTVNTTNNPTAATIVYDDDHDAGHRTIL